LALKNFVALLLSLVIGKNAVPNGLTCLERLWSYGGKMSDPRIAESYSRRERVSAIERGAAIGVVIWGCDQVSDTV
jgi:hypothetical protein